MALAGIRTTDAAELTDADELIGNHGGSTGRLSMERLVHKVLAMVGPTYRTSTELLADLNWHSGALGVAYEDPDSAVNGLYAKSGVYGQGSWTRLTDNALNVATAQAVSAKADAEAARGDAQISAASTAIDRASVTALATALPADHVCATYAALPGAPSLGDVVMILADEMAGGLTTWRTYDGSNWSAPYYGNAQFPTVSAMLGAPAGLQEGLILSAEGWTYKVAAASATDHHLTTTAGDKLYLCLWGSAIDLCALGAPDDLTTDIADIIEAAVAMDRDIIFPRRFAIARTVRLSGAGKSFHFPDSTAVCLAGSYFAVYEFGSGNDTGKKVVLSLGTDTAGCLRCNFTGSLTIGSAGNPSGVTALNLLAAERLGFCARNQFPAHFYVGAAGFEHIVYGQGTTQPVAGSFTGSTFYSLESNDGIGCVNLRDNQDDVFFQIIRSRGTDRYERDAVIASYFLYGPGAVDEVGLTGIMTGNTNDGIVMGSFAHLKVLHFFVERGFRYPVLINGADNSFDASIRVSGNFSSQNGHVVTCNTDDCVVRLQEQPMSRQGTHVGYISRNPLFDARGLFEVSLTTQRGQPDYKEAITYTGGAVSTDDTIRVTEPGNCVLEGAYRNSALTYRQFCARDVSIRNQDGSAIFFLQRAGEAVIPVTELQRQDFYNPNASLLCLDSAVDIEIRTYGVITEHFGADITLTASGAGRVRLRGDALGPIKFANGEAFFDLLGNGGSALTMRFSPQLNTWLEISRVTY